MSRMAVDAGVSRTGPTNEYLRAATGHGLGDRDVEAIRRAGIAYSCARGGSRWRDPRRFVPVAACPLRIEPGLACPHAAIRWRRGQAFDRFDAGADPLAATLGR